MQYQSAQDLVKDVKTLVSLPDIYFQLNEMIADQRFSLEDIGRVIAKDPGLSARLLKVVNSALYGFQSRIDTIPRAIAVVGIDDLYNLVVATCVVDRFSGISSDLMDMVDFWTHSVHCAVLCRLLARSGAILHADRLFLAGLLHDIGSLAMFVTIPRLAEQVLLASDHDRRLRSVIEQEMIGFTHADVGRALLQSWKLPESLSEVVGCYRNPDAARNHRLDAHILNLSTRLLEDSQLGRPAEETLQEIDDSELILLRLTREQVVLIFEQSVADFFDVFEMLIPDKTSLHGKVMPH